MLSDAGRSSFGIGRRLKRFSTLIADPAAPIDGKTKMHAGGREKQIMREYPEPVADIERRKECGKARGEVEIGECVVQHLREPDFSRDHLSG